MKLVDTLKGYGVRLAYKMRPKTWRNGMALVRLNNTKNVPIYRREILLKGSVNGPDARPLQCDIVVERDVSVKMRDGITIYTDIFRPAGEEKVPAIVAWSPYGKTSPMYELSRIPRERLSNLQKFEAPDPAYWVDKGYAVINPDIRGSGLSEGNLMQWGSQDGRDGYDLTEWLAVQDWCNGKVGFAGNSYLAISQWFIGAELPPHLAALAPWEGAPDCYRHSIAPGGIPSPEFNMMSIFLKGKAFKDDWYQMIKQEPLPGSFWTDKMASVKQISVPVYVVSSYTNKVHTRGTIHGFNALEMSEKWLRIHNSHEWKDFYDNQDDLRRFFDRYLKGLNNGWEETPTVRMAVLNPGGQDISEKAADKFPPSGVHNQTFYLNAANLSITDKKPESESQVSYSSESANDEVTFTLRFEEDTEISGFMVLKLWVSVSTGHDSDLFFRAIKLDNEGTELPVLVKGAPYSGEDGSPYEWGNGQIRISQRKITRATNPGLVPILAHDEYWPVRAGEIVQLEVELPPIAIRFSRGQQLRLIIAGHVLQKPEFTFLIPEPSSNTGRVTIYTGLTHASSLELPVNPCGNSKS